MTVKRGRWSSRLLILLIVLLAILPGTGWSAVCDFDSDGDGDSDGRDLAVFVRDYGSEEVMAELELFEAQYGLTQCMQAVAPSDIDQGLAFDEQQGGGGLIGDSVRILNGNAVEYRSDLYFDSAHRFGLAFSATYNSRSARSGALGVGWTHTYEAFLEPEYDYLGRQYLKLTDNTGHTAYFREKAGGLYSGVFGEKSSVKAENGEYIWHRLDDFRFVFSPAGQLQRIEDANANRLVMTYDALGRLEFVTDNASSRVLGFEYNAAGQIDQIIGPISEAVADGRWVSFGYDGDQNLTMVSYADDSGFAYGYHDAADPHNLTEVRNKAGHLLKSFSYDDQDRAAANFSSRGLGVSVNYVNANQADVTDAYGVLRSYRIDTIGGRKRIVDMQCPAAAPYTDSSIVRWQYDEQLNLTEVQIADGTIHQYKSFNDRGRLISKTSMINGISYAMSRSYSPGSRRLSFSYPSGRTINYTRYETGRIQRVSTSANADSVTLLDNLSYDPFGAIKGIQTGSGGTVSNQSGDCHCLEVINPGKTMEQIYSYDHNGNLIQIEATNTSWFSQSFDYDAMDRLTYAAGGLYGTIEYSYDKVGNRLSRTVNSANETYLYQPGTNRLAEISGADAKIFSYAANGNISAINGRRFNYNQNNRLIRVEEGVAVLGEYGYNGLGQRATKKVDGVLRVFHYDFDGNIIAESLPDGTVSTEYLYMGGSRVAKVDNSTGKFYFYLNNYLGTPLLLTDDQNKVVWEGNYKPFGESAVNPNSTGVVNFRFAGQYYDEETGLHYNRHRYYDPKTGRYLTPDPIGLAEGVNLYVYANQNPINLTDPYGLVAGLDDLGILILAGGGLIIAGVYYATATPEQRQAIDNGVNKLIGLMNPGPLLSDVGKAYQGDYVIDPLTGKIYFLNDLYNGPSDPTDLKSWEEWDKERDKRIYDETSCETRTPWMGPGKGYDPDDPDNDPKAPLWKKIARVIMDLVRAGNP